MTDDTITQIIPARNWYAVLLLDEAPWFDFAPVAGWALVERTEDGDSWTTVEGLVPLDGVALVEASGNFSCYVHKRQRKDPDLRAYWVREARRRATDDAERRKVNEKREEWA